jgi:hypothetical protein
VICLVKNNTKVNNVNNLSPLYNKNIKCPVCNASFKAKAMRKGKYKLISRDLDTMPRYEPYNPMFYEVIICPSCGYAALSPDFENITSLQIDLINQNLNSNSKLKPHNYPDTYDADIAIERYKFALIFSIIKKDKMSIQALICLKIAWMYRLKEDKTEVKFLADALNGFKKAYEAETFPVCGMNQANLMFLIGELSRRVGKYDEALQWLSRVVTKTGVAPKTKEMARDSKELIKEAL